MKSGVGTGEPRMKMDELPPRLKNIIKADGATYYDEYFDANYDRIFMEVLIEVAETIE